MQIALSPPKCIMKCINFQQHTLYQIHFYIQHFVPNVFFSFDSTFLYQMYITFNGTLQLKMFYFAYQRKILFGLLFNFSFFIQNVAILF